MSDSKRSPWKVSSSTFCISVWDISICFVVPCKNSVGEQQEKKRRKEREKLVREKFMLNVLCFTTNFICDSVWYYHDNKTKKFWNKIKWNKIKWKFATDFTAMKDLKIKCRDGCWHFENFDFWCLKKNWNCFWSVSFACVLLLSSLRTFKVFKKSLQKSKVFKRLTTFHKHRTSLNNSLKKKTDF